MLVIHNARIYTQNQAQPFAASMAVEGDTIMAVGLNDHILSSFTTANKLNARGRVVLPGLTDAHIHLEDYAFSHQKVDCHTSTRQECLQRVAERAIITPRGDWILGHGWNQNGWPEGYGFA
ncbi:MAG: amidohydrolase family protein, partial [Acidobacteriaceae bacterium]